MEALVSSIRGREPMMLVDMNISNSGPGWELEHLSIVLYMIYFLAAHCLDIIKGPLEEKKDYYVVMTFQFVTSHTIFILY